MAHFAVPPRPSPLHDLENPNQSTVEAGLSRRIEEASLNAWPALQQVLLDGWVLRFSKGFTRRANSVTPVYPSARPPLPKVRYCENLYAQEGLPTLFRLTSLGDAALDRVLADRGYESDGRTRVLHRPLEAGTFAPGPGFALVPVGSFLDTYTELSGLRGHLKRDGLDPQAAVKLHGSVLRGIRADTVFGVLAGDFGVLAGDFGVLAGDFGVLAGDFGVLAGGGEPVACGMAVVEGELAGLFDIVTDPATRRRGYGRLLVQSLLAHAAAMGATRTYLQVLEDNAPALALYDGLGFDPLYEYWYRVSPGR